MRHGRVIKVNDVSMMFNLSSEKIDSIKEYFIKAVRRELHFQEFWAAAGYRSRSKRAILSASSG